MTDAPTRPKLRVLALTNMWPHAADPAYGTFVASQMRSLEKVDVEVEVDFVNGKATRFAYGAAALRMLALNLGRRRYDLVHAHTGHCGVLARLQWRYPVVLSYVGYDVYGNPTAVGAVTTKSRLEAALFRQLGRVVDRTITKSARMERLLPTPVRARNVVLPNGVDRELFRPIDRATARASLGWPAESLTAVFVGRPGARKRHELAAEACALAAAQLPALEFLVCSGVAQEAVPVWMCAADVLMLPSLAEGSPNVVKEALACNLPVVATDVGDVAELLEGVDRCRVLDIDASAADFADALLDVLADAPRRTDGRAHIDHLDADAVAERLRGLYDDVLAHRRERETRRA